MPEGHSVHRVARDHCLAFANQKMIVLSPQGRFEAEAKKISGRHLIGAEAFGKHLVYLWGTKTRAPKVDAKPAAIMHVHLGLYGKFRLHKNPPPDPRGAVRVRMIGYEKAFDLNGPNTCRLLSKEEFRTLKNRIGADPLRADADPELAWQKITKSRKAIGALLLDQSVVAGIGNIYRAEILFKLGIHPETKGCELSRETFDELWALSVELLQIGLKYNRIITVDRSDIDKPLSRLTRAERLLVYKKSRCSNCGNRVRQWEVAARKMYACEKCQRRVA
ncbi:Fpg/Nei family DNA glycosylase [Mariniblastus fucicola]|uniref:DNA-(apurinic or apyrimidinic site) lyase n=1 Tax=Mariniblastus fucicola TaxID=980251 RepID=A0A5B9P6C6_9BACT|nr:DNA glycosylase [Mariniblastus fucicola]QEG20206.1 Endonuclease 8 1 [Mariniblastus fucicola]